MTTHNRILGADGTDQPAATAVGRAARRSALVAGAFFLLKGLAWLALIAWYRVGSGS
jgi:hypothetical protein